MDRRFFANQAPAQMRVISDKPAQRVMPLCENPTTLNNAISAVEGQRVPGFTAPAINNLQSPPLGETLPMQRGGISEDKINLATGHAQGAHLPMPTAGAPPTTSSNTILIVAAVAIAAYFLLKN